MCGGDMTVEQSCTGQQQRAGTDGTDQLAGRGLTRKKVEKGVATEVSLLQDSHRIGAAGNKEKIELRAGVESGARGEGNAFE